MISSKYDQHPLSPSTIKRAREGLRAAQNPALRKSIAKNLQELEEIAEGKVVPRIQGKIRRLVLRGMIHFLFKVKVENPENIPQTPTILAANHLNHIDPFLVLAEVPVFPYYYILGDARSLYNKLWKRLILNYSGGVIPVERRWGEEEAVIEAAKSHYSELMPLANAIERDVPSQLNIKTLRQINRAISQIFENGDSILLFPEGRLGKNEGQLILPLKRGTILYSFRSGIPIVPVALIGTNNLYFRKTLTLRFGKPLRFPHISRPKPQEREQGLQQLTEAMTKTLPENYQEPQGIKLFSRILNHLFD